jgi:hypothetical protein
MGIVETGQLWASNASFLNDRRELIHGLEASIEAVQELATEAYQSWKKVLDDAVQELRAGQIPDTFVACFCRREDALGQWRGYCGAEQGVAIVFDAAKLSRILKPYRARLMKVIYGTVTAGKKMRREIERELDELDGIEELIGRSTTQERRGDALSLLSRLIPRFKHNAFVDEQEWRYVVQRGDRSPDVRFRRKDNVIVPYVELGSNETKLPIKRVLVGPGKEPELTRKSIEMLLGHFGYDGVRVRVSKVPFRT